MKTLLIAFLILFAANAHGQQIYTLDSVNGISLPDTIYDGSAKIGVTRPVSRAYFNRGSSTLRMDLHDISVDASFHGAAAISIPTVGAGTYVGTVDSSYIAPYPVRTSTGDTISPETYYARFNFGGSKVTLQFIGLDNNALSQFLPLGTIAVFIKQ